MLGLPSVVDARTRHLAVTARGPRPDFSGWVAVTLENRFIRLGEPGWHVGQLRYVTVEWNARTGEVIAPQPGRPW